MTLRIEDVKFNFKFHISQFWHHSLPLSQRYLPPRPIPCRGQQSSLPNSHFQFVYYLHTFRNEVFKAFIKVLICIVWFFAHFNKCRFNECLCLFKVQCAITIVIKFVSNVLYHRIYGVVYVFVLFTVHAWLGFSGFNFFILKVSVIVTVSTS